MDFNQYMENIEKDIAVSTTFAILKNSLKMARKKFGYFERKCPCFDIVSCLDDSIMGFIKQVKNGKRFQNFDEVKRYIAKSFYNNIKTSIGKENNKVKSTSIYELDRYSVNGLNYNYLYNDLKEEDHFTTRQKKILKFLCYGKSFSYLDFATISNLSTEASKKSILRTRKKCKNIILKEHFDGFIDRLFFEVDYWPILERKLSREMKRILKGEDELFRKIRIVTYINVYLRMKDKDKFPTYIFDNLEKLGCITDNFFVYCYALAKKLWKEDKKLLLSISLEEIKETFERAYKDDKYEFFFKLTLKKL